VTEDPPAPAMPLEDQVKAAFVYNFARFVEWPSDALEPSGVPLSICVLGDDLMGQALEQAARGKIVDGHSLTVRRLTERDPVGGCPILFVGAMPARARSDELARLQDRSVLTVSDSEGFAGDRSIVAFFKAGNKVRFRINIDAAQRARLKISSRLLGVADVVRESSRKEGH